MKHDTRWIVGFLLLGAVGLWTFLNQYDKAIPVASLDFKLSREEAFLEAQSFAFDREHDLQPFESAQIFAPDMMAQIFLQKTLGLEETNRLARDWVSLYQWQVRWYRPLEKEEIYVFLDPGGRVVGYDHGILDEDPGADLVEADALKLAEAFLFAEGRFDRDDWEEVERSSEKRTARTDHTFTYRKRGFTVGDDGHYRARVVVQGDRVGNFQEFVFVPETFRRDFRETRSQANLLNSVFGIFWILLGVAVLVILAQRYKAGGLQWRSSTILGIGVLVAMMLAQLNSIPLVEYRYDTTESLTSFYLQILVGAILASVLVGAIVAMTGTAGAWVTRDVTGTHDLYPRLSFRNLISGRYVRATLIGYGLAGAMLGYLILFHFLGKELFGIWSPAYVIEYDNAFSTAFPWAYPLLVGLMAAAQEEFFFRLLAISLLLKLSGIRWLAILAPAIVWGFLHSNYPVEPIYARGVELTIVGVGFGFVFLRWGIWSVIVAHYAYNAFVVAFPMMRSSSLYFQVSGVAVIGLLCLPVLFAIVSALRGRDEALTSDEEEEVDEQQAPPPDSVEARESVEVEPTVSLSDYGLSSRTRTISIGIIVFGLLVIWGLDRPQLGDRGRTEVLTRSLAEAKADSVMQELGWALEGGHQYALYYDALRRDGLSYLIRKVGVEAADSLVYENLLLRQWRVRWFKPLEKTEYRIAIDTSGDLASVARILPDSLSGASLSGDEARLVAEAALVRHLATDVTDPDAFKIIQSRSDKKESRTDHHFVWERLGPKVEEGEFRVNASVQGDSFGRASFSFKAPEAFLRDLQERDAIDAVLQVFLVLGLLVLIASASMYFFRYYRAGAITWRVPLIFGAAYGLGELIELLNRLPLFYQGFNTSQSLSTFLGSKAVSLLTTFAIGPAAFAVLVALSIALWRDLAPAHVDFPTSLSRLWQGEGRGIYLLDCLISAEAAIIIGQIGTSIRVYVKSIYFEQYATHGPNSIPGQNDVLPFLGSLGQIASGLTLILIGIGIILVARRFTGSWKLVFVLYVSIPSLQQLGMSEDLLHGVTIVGITALFTAAAALYAVRVIGYNVLAYAILFIFLNRTHSGLRMLGSDELWYDLNGVGILLLALLPLWAGLYFWLVRPTTRLPSASSPTSRTPSSG